MSVTRTNEKKVIIASYDKINLKVDYFWDDHGKLINWNDATNELTFWLNVNVQIVRYSFTETLLDNEYDFETDQLIVNGETISGSVLSYELRDNTLYCRVAVGWG